METEERIQAMLDCARVCEETMMHCLKTSGEHAAADHITSLIDCAKVCKLTADLMIRDSPAAKDLMGACASICDRCAASCERFGDEKMDVCVKACRDCAAACRLKNEFL